MYSILPESSHLFVPQSDTLLVASLLNLLVELAEFRSGLFLASLYGHLVLFHFN